MQSTGDSTRVNIDILNQEKSFKMARGKHLQQIDLKALQELKKLLFCSICETFPRPGSNVYSCKICNNLVCDQCWNEVEPNLEMKFFCKKCHEECVQKCYGEKVHKIALNYGYSGNQMINLFSFDEYDLYHNQRRRQQSFVNTSCSVNHHYKLDHVNMNPGLADPIASKLVALFKFRPCIYLKNGCQDEFDAKELEEHQKTCIFRNVTCPDLQCFEEFPFNTILDHYKPKPARPMQVGPPIPARAIHAGPINAGPMHPGPIPTFFNVMMAMPLTAPNRMVYDDYYDCLYDDGSPISRNPFPIRPNLVNSLPHSGLETKNDTLDFNGTVQQLSDKTFILNSYGKPFFPQFHINGNTLHFWVVGHCDEVEANMFEASISFFYNGKWNRALMDNVKPIDMDKQSLKNGEFGLIFPLKTLTQYFDHQAKVRKNHDMIEFELKIVCEKLDEIAKDENVESGVEDSDDN